MYFQRAKLGKNDFLRYLAGIFITFFIGYGFLGPLPLQYVLLEKSGLLKKIMAAMGDSDELKRLRTEAVGIFTDATQFDDIIGSKNLTFLLITSIFLFTMLVFWWVIKTIHLKKLLWVATGAERFRWNQFWFAFTLGAILVIGSVASYYITDPGNVHFRLEPQKFIVLVLIAAIMIPIQAGWEELFFRGYLMQGFSLAFNNKILALLITTFFFAALHMFNPEVMEHGIKVMFPIYFFMGLSFGITVLMSDGLELAMGYHIANNFWIAILFTSPESVLQTDSLFYTNNVQDVGAQFLPLLITNIIVLSIFAWRYNWMQDWQERLFGAIN